MELKQSFARLECCLQMLLIVPYGIETDYQEGFINLVLLLIVPYGIETKL